MTPREHLELHPVDYEGVWSDGYDAGEEVGYEAGLATGAKIRPLHIVTLLLLGTFVGSALTLIAVGVVHAATPLPASDPAIPVAAQARTGASPVVAQLAEHRDARRYAGSTPAHRTEVAPLGAPLSGIASWYPARGFRAAAGPGLRHGDWRGSHLAVSANGRSVTVELADVCGCPGGRLIDLSDDAFRQLAPLSRGLVRVTIAAVGPAPTLPPTDSGGKP